MLRDSNCTQELQIPDAKPGRDQRCEKGATNEMKSGGKGGKKAYPILCRAGWDYDLHSPSLTTQFWIKPASAPGVREGKICCAVSGDQQICQPRRGAARLKLTKKQKKKRGCEILACTKLEEAAKAAGQPGVLVPSISLHHAQVSGRHHALLRRVLGWFWGVLSLWCSSTGWARCRPALSQKARLEIQCENAMEINAKY